MFTHLVALGLLAVGAGPSDHSAALRSALRNRPVIVQGPRLPPESADEDIVDMEQIEGGDMDQPIEGDTGPFYPPAGHRGPRRRSDDCWRDTNCDAPIGTGGRYRMRPACGLPQHYAYLADPKFYYYFRPYNWFQIEPQQQEVENYGLDPRNPYDNRFLQAAYERVEATHPIIGAPAEPVKERVAPPHFLPAPEEQPAIEPPAPGPDADEPAGPSSAIEAPQDDAPAPPKPSPRRPKTSGGTRLPLLPAHRSSQQLRFRGPALPQNSVPQDAPTDESDTVQSGAPATGSNDTIGQPRLLRFVSDVELVE